MDSKKVTLKIISELSCEILTEYEIFLHDLKIPRFNELIENIWDIHPYLYYEENYVIYWRYNDITFLRVKDYFSYFAALELMVDYVFYVIIRDMESWVFVDEITDKCMCSCSKKNIILKEYKRNKLLYMDFNEFLEDYNCVKDEDVLLEAIADLPKPKYFGYGELEYCNKLDCIKKGRKKILDMIKVPDDDIVHLRLKSKDSIISKKSKKSKKK